MSIWRVGILSGLLLLTSAIFYLGYSVNKVAVTVTETTKQVPIVLDKVAALEKKINSQAWLTQVASLQQDIPGILKEVDGINANLADINKQIPLVLAQVSMVAMTTVPNVLAEVKQIRETSLPQVLSELKLAQRQTVPNILKESQAIRTQVIPPVLKESAALRVVVPKAIKDANELVSNAERVGREASAGAVEGTVEGIIGTPMNLIRKLGDTVDPRESDASKQEQEN